MFEILGLDFLKSVRFPGPPVSQTNYSPLSPSIQVPRLFAMFSSDIYKSPYKYYYLQ
jgi:hypothetical protein